jgi:hypothetical protein
MAGFLSFDMGEGDFFAYPPPSCLRRRLCDLVSAIGTGPLNEI